MNRSYGGSRLVGAALSVGLLLAVTAGAQAAPFVLAVNGVTTTLDPPPLVDGGELLLSAPVISHMLGIAVFPTRNPGMWVASAYGKQIYLRANTARYLREGQEVESVHAPRLQGGQMHVPLALLCDNFGLRATRPADGRLEITGAGATVQDIRQGSHPDWIRIVIDVSGNACFQWTQGPTTLTLRIPPGAEATPPTFRKLTFTDDLAPEIIQEPAPAGGTSITIGNRCPTQALVFTLADPARIVVDLPRQAPQVPGPVSAPEPLEYHREEPWQVQQIAGSCGPAVAYVLTLPVGNGRARIRPALAGDTVWGKAALTTITSRAGAYAALNGGYFARGGGPLGMVMVDGEWIKEPILGRTVLGIMRDGSVQMANVRFDGRATVPGAGTFQINALNSGDTDGVILYTGRWGAPVPAKPGATRLMLSGGGEVLVVNGEGRGMEIPQGGGVLSVSGSEAARARKAQKGSVVDLQLATDPPWPGLCHALGGGPRLVANGRPYVTAGAEEFRPDIACGAAPRSAVGVMPNGDVVFVAVDGRQAGYSVGLTLSDLAGFLVDLGVKDAMNFDGGGSTTLVVSGDVVNQPSEGDQRALSTALVAFRAARR